MPRMKTMVRDPGFIDVLRNAPDLALPLLLATYGV